MAGDDIIEQLVAGVYDDPDGDGTLDTGVRSVVIADDIAGREAALIAELDFGPHLMVVSDATTREVLGRRIERAVGGRFAVKPVVLGAQPHADDRALAAVEAGIEDDTDGLIAVGSGTINDLCKAAAARADLPYAVFGTAPSMNGYASATASITVNGLKSSLPARAPVGVFLDVRVMAEAPLRMRRAGLAECLVAGTAKPDWLLAHMVMQRPYREAPFAILRDDEAAVATGAAAVVSGDMEVIRHMARTLVLSGMGMTICGSSRPASQGEHLISHYIDMSRGPDEAAPYHGEQIAVTSLFMARLQERILADEEPPTLRLTNDSEDEILRRFGESLGRACWNELSGKRLDQVGTDELNRRLIDQWPVIRTRIAAAARPADQLGAVLQAAGAPTRPGDLDWSDERFAEACRHAREIRNRYTFLDFVAAAGRDPVAVVGAA
ncbi:MAG: iron-containing alcohol dehydrogenase [Myxococcota bacterium]